MAFFAYSTNYLIDVENAIIVDVEATTAIRQAEILAAKRMIERAMERFRTRCRTPCAGLRCRYVHLNRSKLKREMEKKVEKFEKKFLGHDIVEEVGPWVREMN